MNEEEKQQLLFEASFIEKQMQDLQQQSIFINNEQQELENLSKNLDYIIMHNKKEIIASIGKGVRIPAQLISAKELIVDVGAGVMVKKTLPQAKEVIEQQVKRLQEAGSQIAKKQEQFHKILHDMLNSLGLQHQH